MKWLQSKLCLRKSGTVLVIHFVDMICMNAAESGAAPLISMEKLQAVIPSVEWSKGHSGALLYDDVIDELVKLIE